MMHPNPIFRNETDKRNLAFVCERSFGLIAINGDDGPLTASVPALYNADTECLEFHLNRTNPVAEGLAQAKKATFVFSGPDGYVSPDWYGVPDQVPTWNYVSVRIKGEARLAEQGELHAILDRLSAEFEGRLIPKKPWTIDKMDATVLASMMAAIVPCVMRIETIDGTWKLNQNKPPAVQRVTADAIAQSSIGLATSDLATQMRDKIK